MKYEQNFTFSDDDFDSYGNIIPSKILEVFETGANAHGSLIGVSFEDMIVRNLLWVVTHIKYEVLKKVQPNRTVKLVTWPLPPTLMGFQRDYTLYDEDDNVIIKGTSNWVTIDTEKRKLKMSSDIFPKGDFLTDKNFSERIRRLRDFEAEGKPYIVVPDERLIDRNGHVNNTNYADFAVDSLKGLKGLVKTFQIDYINEVMCGEPLNLYTLNEDSISLVKGESEEGTNKFICKFEFV